jgi:hypothetical protein
MSDNRRKARSAGREPTVWSSIHITPALDYGWLVTGIGAVIAFFWKVYTDSRAAALKRFDKFQKMREVLDKDNFKKVKALVYNQPQPKPEIPCSVDDKINYMAFYEEIALMVRSHLMREDVAFYMFGMDAVAAFDSDLFWEKIEGAKTAPEWKLFRFFCSRMRALNEKYEKEPPVTKFRI